MMRRARKRKTPQWMRSIVFRDAHLCIVALYIVIQPHFSAATPAASPRAEGAAEACADQLSIWIGAVGVVTVPGLLGGTDY